MKINCWEFFECGKEPGGAKTAETGVCPAAESTEHNGKNGGINGGRYCWKVPDTLCDTNTEGNKPERMLKCFSCRFFIRVQDEEGSCFEM
ncbi:MAG: hypothetical protein PHP01_04455 [Phycisphaerae bacterium]|nr:hypothetical protein [Phycisphaerae bacterium]